MKKKQLKKQLKEMQKTNSILQFENSILLKFYNGISTLIETIRENQKAD